MSSLTLQENDEVAKKHGSLLSIQQIQYLRSVVRLPFSQLAVIQLTLALRILILTGSYTEVIGNLSSTLFKQ